MNVFWGSGIWKQLGWEVPAQGFSHAYDKVASWAVIITRFSWGWSGLPCSLKCLAEFSVLAGHCSKAFVLTMCSFSVGLLTVWKLVSPGARDQRERERDKEIAAVVCNSNWEVTNPHFHHMLLVPQSNSERGRYLTACEYQQVGSLGPSFRLFTRPLKGLLLAK